MTAEWYTIDASELEPSPIDDEIIRKAVRAMVKEVDRKVMEAFLQ